MVGDEVVMLKKSNIVESVDFLAEEDLLVSELDKRLSYTALLMTGTNNEGDARAWCPYHGDPVCPSMATAVRG
jgi:hypothetical protein